MALPNKVQYTKYSNAPSNAKQYKLFAHFNFKAITVKLKSIYLSIIGAGGNKCFDTFI